MIRTSQESITIPGPAQQGKDVLWTRRRMLSRCGSGLGMLALASLLRDQARLQAAVTRPTGLGLGPGHRAGTARSVIWLFMEGGPSAFDLFDPKPELQRNHGKRLDGVEAPFFGNPGPLMKSPYSFRQHGDSGAWVSEIMPCTAQCVDDIAFLKAVHCDSNTHAPAMYQMNTGYTRPGFPSAGAWASYGLGSENANLPGFVILPKQEGIKGGAHNWGSGFLPGRHQGTLFQPTATPILNLQRAPGLSDAQQRSQLDLARALNERHLAERPAEADLEARIASFELGYRMQSEAVEAVDVDRESRETRDLYGLEDETTADYGRKLLMARRLVERGVRFVQAYPAREWDAHQNLKENHDRNCAMTDRPVAGLLKDLRQRGLLESTLVIWGGEFGRLPISQQGLGRDHNPKGFLLWMAGGGIKGGASHGETDEVGYLGVSGQVSLPDVHATILHLLGLDHEVLTYKHSGRSFRLTDVSGRVIEEILA